MTSRFWRDKSPLNPYLASVEEINEQGNWDEVDSAYVLSCHTVRKVRQIETDGGAYNGPRRNGSTFQAKSPQEWMLAIQLAEQEEQKHFESLTTDHGYPDTTGMDWRQAHHARLQHLMTKYPKADWVLLQHGQFDGWDRKPKEATPPPPVTVQRIETIKRRYVANSQQLKELLANDENNDTEGIAELRRLLPQWGRFLTRHGVDPASLLQESSEPEEQASEQMVEQVSEQAASTSVEREPASTEGQASASGKLTLSPTEVSKIVGLHYQTVIKYLATGELPFGKKTGGKWTVAREPFLGWLHANDDAVRELAAPKPRAVSKTKATEPTNATFIHGRRASF